MPPLPLVQHHQQAPALHWDAVLHLVLHHLQLQQDRTAVRLVCKEWRSAADATWQAGALNCQLLPANLPDAAVPAGAAMALLQPGAFLLPRLRELCLAEIHSSAQLGCLLRQLTGDVAPALRRLQLSAPLHERLSDGGLLASVQLPALQRLSLDDVMPQRGLASFSHLRQLTELAVSLTHSEAGAGGQPPRTVQGVRHLAALPHLQALALPELGEQEREALAALTALTRLAFTAAGKGAVGPSLLALTRLESLAISLAHKREHFIVLHPRVDWGALRTLRCLRQLSLCHLAAYAFFPAPEVTWSEDAPVAVEVERLLAELPGIQTAQIRLSYCRLAEEQLTPEDEPETLHIPSPSGAGQPRTFLRCVRCVPLRQPGMRRADEWYEAWWQPALLTQLEELAGAAGSGGGLEQAGGQPAGHPGQHVLAPAGHSRREVERWLDLAQERLMEEGEARGWAAIRPGAYRTHDILASYWQPG